MRKTCVDMVYELAKKDPRVIFIGSDLSPGLLKEMQQEMPSRYYMEGISEAHVIGMSAGLAMDGYIPFVNTIATFLTRRSYEQIALDLCLHNLPVRLIGNGGGLVYAPLGPTHLAIEDFSLMRTLPNMIVTAVSDAEEMKRLMNAILDVPNPVYIRLGKGGDPVISRDDLPFEIGKGIVMTNAGKNAKVVIASTGVMTKTALDVASKLNENQISTEVLHFHTIKPLDEALVLDYAKSCDLLVTLEEHVITGGLGSAIIETLIDKADFKLPKIVRLGLPDQFPKHYGSQQEHLKLLGLDADSIYTTINHNLSKVI